MALEVLVLLLINHRSSSSVNAAWKPDVTRYARGRSRDRFTRSRRNSQLSIGILF